MSDGAPMRPSAKNRDLDAGGSVSLIKPTCRLAGVERILAGGLQPECGHFTGEEPILWDGISIRAPWGILGDTHPGHIAFTLEVENQEFSEQLVTVETDAAGLRA